jgi:ABC-type branched-subunit amino acid transport system substrate-binding protein
MRSLWSSSFAVIALLAATACEKKEPAAPAAEGKPAAAAPAPAAAPAAKAPGVDLEKKVIKVGALNDESGPGAAIGKPYALGKRMLVKAIAAGEVKLLPEGWTIELVEKDHAYNPQQSVQHYNAIKDEVLFIGTSFGTPNTLPLRPMLARDKLIAYPASTASDMGESPYTPPLATSYKLEAMRAMDWVVEQAGDPKKIKAGLVYQQDDYGKDGQAGWVDQAKVHGVEIVDQQAVAPGQKDYAAVVSSLKAKGATHVLLTTLPSSTAPILGTATQLGYTPVWIGNNPTWVDRFFDPKVVPPQILANFHWVHGMTYWGEDLPNMKTFLSVYEKYGKDLSEPNHYLLISYVQGMIEIEVAAKALAAGPLTRESYLQALQTLDNYDAQGLGQPISMKKFPYVPAIRSRVLKPKLAERTWEVVAPYAAPKGMTI